MQLRSTTIRVVAVSGSEDLPVGASRTFLLTDEGGHWRIEGKELSAWQIRGRGERRKLIADLERDR